MHRSRATLLIATCVLVAGAAAGGYALFPANHSRAERATAAGELKLSDIPFDGARAFDYLTKICNIGPRPSGSEGMRRQQALLDAHFKKLGGEVSWQGFRARHPRTGQPVEMANLIVHWHPQSKQRVLLCAHYDTRPYPSEDSANPRGVFVGANDGGSGVAVLMELAHQMPTLEVRYGVDFVLFDAEEFVFEERDTYFLGSEWFARDYKQNPPTYQYRWGILLDMVGDADLQLYYEGNSVRWRDTRPLTHGIWQTAARLGVREFIPQRRHELRDDHLLLRNIARIPTCDVIDFDYPHWHTQADVPENCSALSLAKVGWVLSEWLKTAPTGDR